jgi:cysteine desulfurase/selenocysteine lyase
MSSASSLTPSRLDVDAVRRDFPILSQLSDSGRPLVYLDSGATSQKPRCVIDKLTEVFVEYNSNVHRGVHALGDRVTGEMEGARERIRRLIHAPEVDEVIFTGGTTLSINTVAYGWGRKFLVPGDEILLTEMEHHANLVPWQMVARERGAVLRFIPQTADGRLDLDRLDEVLSRKTRLVAVTGMSNVLGTINPVGTIAARARGVGAVVLVDGAQSVPHEPVDVQGLGIDFLVFSGHKLYGPTGIGVLWGRRELLEAMDPFLGGGNMISRVWSDRFEVGALPAKFEAGTPPIAEAIALGTAIEYVESLGFEAIGAWEHQLTVDAYSRLSQIEGLQILGPGVDHRGSIISFAVEGLQASDLAAVLDTRGIAVRAGHHCTMPLHDRLGISASTRASLAFYNTPAEIDQLCEGINHARKVLTRRRRG